MQALFIALLIVGSMVAFGQERAPQRVAFFDVPDLPARIDDPKLGTKNDHYTLNCTVVNRSSEVLRGFGLTLLVVEPTGKLRVRIEWSEGFELDAYSIKSFTFHPTLKYELHATDRLFLAIEEATGGETIWRLVDGVKSLRAYSRGQHDLIPTVRVMTNAVDGPPPRNRRIPFPWEKRR
ncbi:MAG: hypothetical protein ACT4OT_00915 [Acidobacteriota bacterium]